MRRTTRPEPPPEAPLIDAARRQRRITVRELARQARISEALWRQIVSGYESLGAGQYREVRAKPETLARIALALGLTPEQLTRVGREDAATALEEITPEPEPQAPPYSPPVDAVYQILAALPPEAQEEVIRRLRETGRPATPESEDRRRAG